MRVTITVYLKSENVKDREQARAFKHTGTKKHVQVLLCVQACLQEAFGGLLRLYTIVFNR
jgi:hypothetical protein